MITRRRGNREFEVPKTIMRVEEIVAANTSFDLNINMDNVDEHDVGMLLLALNEFNFKRCHLGGGASRGNGFADVEGLKVVKKSVRSGEESLFEISEEQQDIDQLQKSAKDYLRNIDDGNEVKRRDFDVYYRAYQPSGMSGHLVVKYNLPTLKNFQMPGADEATVTNYGVPVIPGSTIKGFLRHKLIDDNVDASTIDELFGSMRGNRSRIIVSDAYPNSEFSGRDMIPEGTQLTLWIVFDNVEENEVKLVNDILVKPQVITGKRIAGVGKDKPADKNEVRFGAVPPLGRFSVAKYLG